MNGAKDLDFATRILNVDHNGLSALALQGEPSAHGVSLLSYFDGERTPNRPDATGVFRVDVLVPEPGEYVAMGATRQAAWVLSGQALPPAWATQGTPARYEELRDKTEGW